MSLRVLKLTHVCTLRDSPPYLLIALKRGTRLLACMFFLNPNFVVGPEGKAPPLPRRPLPSTAVQQQLARE